MNSNDLLTRMYNDRDRIVNESRSNSLKEYHRKQKEQNRIRTELFDEIRSVWKIIDQYETSQLLFESFDFRWIDLYVIRLIKYQKSQKRTYKEVFEQVLSYFEELDLF